MISNKDIYSRTLPYAKKHKAERKLQRERKITKRKLQKTRVYVNYITFDGPSKTIIDIYYKLRNGKEN